MKFVGSKDFLSGAFFVLAGIAFIVMSRWYNMGTPQRIGPGAFPTLVGGCLALVGAVVALRAMLAEAEPVEPAAWRPFLLVLASVLAFGLLVVPLGLVVTSLLVVAVAAPAARDLTPVQAAVMAVAIAALSAVVFVVLLGLQIDLWPAFLVR